MAWRPRHLRLLARNIKTQARYDYVPPADVETPTYMRSAGLATPRQVLLSLFLRGLCDCRTPSLCNILMNT